VVSATEFGCTPGSQGGNGRDHIFGFAAGWQAADLRFLGFPNPSHSEKDE